MVNNKGNANDDTNGFILDVFLESLETTARLFKSRLKLNEELLHYPWMLFNADTPQNVRLEKVNPGNQKAAKETFNQNVKSAFEQPGPGY